MKNNKSKALDVVENHIGAIKNHFMPRSIEDNYKLIKLIASDFVKLGLTNDVGLFYKCMNEGVALYGQSDVSMESVASTIKEKYLVCNS